MQGVEAGLVNTLVTIDHCAALQAYSDTLETSDSVAAVQKQVADMLGAYEHVMNTLSSKFIEWDTRIATLEKRVAQAGQKR